MDEHIQVEFGPVPLSRQRRYTLPGVGIIMIFSVIVSAICFMTSEDHYMCIKSFFYTFIISCAAILIGKNVHRSCMIFEEKHHLDTRYYSDRSRMLKAIYNRRDVVGLLVFMCIGILMVFDEMSLFTVHISTLNIVAAGAVIPLVFDLFNLNELSEVERSKLSEESAQNVAYGLAWSYYFGYLKIILPELVNMINKSDTWRIKFNGGQLLPIVFALIPKTGFMVGEICDARRQIIYVNDKEEDVLPPLLLERGGVIKRVYRSTVYTIKDRAGQENYAIMEYVTPVDTIYQMNQHSEAGLTEEEKNEQIDLLYRHLKKITNKKLDCRGRCVLVAISGNEEPGELRDIMLDALNKERGRM